MGKKPSSEVPKEYLHLRRPRDLGLENDGTLKQLISIKG
jgi:hypothetical protein